jgi:hypothetical protein
MNKFSIALFGYSILSCVYLTHLYTNIINNEPILIIIGSIMILLGYVLLIKHYYDEQNNDKQNNEFNVKKENINYGYLILFLFFFLSFLIPINSHLKNTDLFALAGNSLLIFQTPLMTFGYIFNIIYYLIYIVKTSLIKYNNIKFVKLVALSLIIYYYCITIYEFYKKYENKNKNI